MDEGGHSLTAEHLVLEGAILIERDGNGGEFCGGSGEDLRVHAGIDFTIKTLSYYTSLLKTYESDRKENSNPLLEERGK